MYKVVIADDNPIICKALTSRIPWDELDLELAGVCNDGSNVLDLALETAPHIIITDIKMPVVDGMTLIEQLRFRQLPLQIIIISGYNDFQYMKKAIDYDVAGYLLKPIQDEDLLSSLRKAIGNLKEKEETSQITESAKILKLREVKRTSNTVLQSLIRGNQSGEEAALAFGNLAFPAPYQWLLFPQPFADRSTSLPAINMEEIIPLELIIRKKLDLDCHVLMPSSTLLAILCPLRSSELTTHCAQLIAEFLQQENRIITSPVTSREFRSPLDMEQELMQAIACLYRAIFKREFTSSSTTNTPGFTLKEQQTIALHLSLRDYRGAYTFAVEKLERCLIEPVSPADLDYFIKTVFKGYSDYIPTLQSVYEQLDSICLPALAFSSTQDFLTRLEETLELSTESCNKATHIVHYIENNLAQPLTLTMLSKTFHHNSIYLGQMIKRETGMSFNQLLNKLRIERAEEMIQRNPQVKLTDLALQLGFSDSKYFSKVFKKLTGNPPSRSV